MRATRDINWLVLSRGVSITQLRTADPMVARAPSVLEVAEAREQVATAEATRQISAWVNEGGAGGEVRR
ncbi:hypothetical protein M2321_003750 [Rhodoblastus acidophilus]|nr:hypothetical protein [Rhodoblastus acidophilus]